MPKGMGYGKKMSHAKGKRGKDRVKLHKPKGTKKQ